MFFLTDFIFKLLIYSIELIELVESWITLPWVIAPYLFITYLYTSIFFYFC